MAKGKPTPWDGLLPDEPKADMLLPEPDGTLPGLIAALGQLNQLPGAAPDATRPEQRDYMSRLIVTLMKQLMTTVPREPGTPAINALVSMALALDSVNAEHKPHKLFTPEKPATPKDGPARRTDTQARRAFVMAAITYLERDGNDQGKAVAILAGMAGVKAGSIKSDLTKVLHDNQDFTVTISDGIVIDSDDRLAAAALQLKDMFKRR